MDERSSPLGPDGSPPTSGDDAPTASADAGPALPRPLAVVAMGAADRAAFVAALADPDGDLPDDITRLTATELGSGLAAGDLLALAEAAADLRRRELAAAEAAEEGAAAAVRAVRDVAEAAESSHRTTMQQVRATADALEALRAEHATLTAQLEDLGPTVAVTARRAELLDSLATEAGRPRDDLRHRAAVAILTVEAEVEAERTARTHADPDDDPAVRSALARLAEADAEIARFESHYGPASLDAAARAAIEAAHDEVDRLRGRRRAEAALATAEAAEAALLAQHGYASYLDYTIGNATLEFGSLAAGGVETARRQHDLARAAVDQARQAVAEQLAHLEVRRSDLDVQAERLVAATSDDAVLELLHTLPAVTGDPTAWQDYARRAAAAVRRGDGTLERHRALGEELLAVETGIRDLETFAMHARGAVASAEVHLVALWADVDDEQRHLDEVVAVRRSAEEALTEADRAVDRRRAGEIDEVDDLVETVLSLVRGGPTGSLLLDDACVDLDTDRATALLEALVRRRPDGDVLCLTEDAALLEWAEAQCVLGTIEPWWQTDGTTDEDAATGAVTH